MIDADLNRDDLPEVVIVINGMLGMSEGKAIGQAFQAAARWQHILKNSYPDNSLNWICQGTRTIVKVARTEGIWERILGEVQGFVMRDEGYTQVEQDAATVFVAYPFLHKDRPKILDNKKVKLL